MGDISTACSTLNYLELSRNFYETSHAKEPQDAAGGFLQKQADLAVLRGKFEIQLANLPKFEFFIQKQAMYK